MTGSFKRKRKNRLLCCPDSKLSKIKGILWSQALNGPLFISSAVSFIRGKKKGASHSTLEISRSNHRYVQTQYLCRSRLACARSACMFLIPSTLLLFQGFYYKCPAKSEANTMFPTISNADDRCTLSLSSKSNTSHYLFALDRCDTRCMTELQYDPQSNCQASQESKNSSKIDLVFTER